MCQILLETLLLFKNWIWNQICYNSTTNLVVFLFQLSKILNQKPWKYTIKIIKPKSMLQYATFFNTITKGEIYLSNSNKQIRNW